ncbi:MAG: protein-L-isoaspartate(D-aspartate) O-methyltransferase [Phycisphaerae bacterium]|nr:protein-L-isoaspartate(D-aspartate) O-methyltransferase [Phycisphaerae bacterium]
MMNPDNTGRDDAGRLARRRMIFEDIYRRGVRNEGVLRAMEDVPREHFLPPELQDAALEDRALPIGAGQTISQPYIVAYMTEQLDVTPESRVLEIGTGSGYQTAILARLAKEVFSIERLDRLCEQARRRLAALGVSNVHLRCADGTLGWSETAPFDRIIVTAAGPQIPPALLDQLRDGGILVAPIGDEQDQRLLKVRRNGPRLIETPLIAVRFVRLIGKSGWKE